jgi:hypothetical protein
MTIEELIEKLKEFPADMPVLHYDDEALELHEVEWVGIMADHRGQNGIVMHHFKPSSEGEWVTRA